MTGPSTARIEDWEELLLRTINDNSQGIKYIKVQSKAMMGLFLVIFTRKDELSNVKDVMIDKLKLGFQGMFGNKGAILARFNLYDTSLAIVNCHLVDGPAAYLERFEQLREIYSANISNGLKTVKVREHDRVFFMGDMNFRINLPDPHTRELAISHNLDELGKHDQLLLNCFNVLNKPLDPHFAEERIRFLPTYKYDPGTCEFDTSEKRRGPAWCDRILWIENQKDDISCKRYDSKMEICYSDHKPIFGVYEVKIAQEDKMIKDEVEREVIYTLNEGKTESLSSLMDREPKVQSVRYTKGKLS